MAGSHVRSSQQPQPGLPACPARRSPGTCHACGRAPRAPPPAGPRPAAAPGWPAPCNAWGSRHEVWGARSLKGAAWSAAATSVLRWGGQPCAPEPGVPGPAHPALPAGRTAAPVPHVAAHVPAIGRHVVEAVCQAVQASGEAALGLRHARLAAVAHQVFQQGQALRAERECLPVRNCGCSKPVLWSALVS